MKTGGRRCDLRIGRKKKEKLNVLLTSLSLLATTLPAVPPPTMIKSYSLSGNALDNGRPHGSSMSHCDLMNTSSKPINSMNADPPHVLANVGPGWVTGQLQLPLISKYYMLDDLWVDTVATSEINPHRRPYSNYTQCVP